LGGLRGWIAFALTAQTRIRKNGAFVSAACNASGVIARLDEAPFFLANLARAGAQAASSQRAVNATCLIASARASAFAVSAKAIHPLSPPSGRGKFGGTDRELGRSVGSRSSALIRKRRSGAVGEPTARGLDDAWTLSARPAPQGLRGKKGRKRRQIYFPPWRSRKINLTPFSPFFPLHVFS
jgi:hypothetical protein